MSPTSGSGDILFWHGRLSVCLSVIKSHPLLMELHRNINDQFRVICNLKTIQDIFMKLMS